MSYAKLTSLYSILKIKSLQYLCMLIANNRLKRMQIMASTPPTPPSPTQKNLLWGFSFGQDIAPGLEKQYKDWRANYFPISQQLEYVDENSKGSEAIIVQESLW